MPSANTNDHESLFESFMESLIPQLPNEIRRSLDHIRVLDLLCTNDFITLQRLQKEFIMQSEYKIMKLKVCPIRSTPTEAGNNSHEGPKEDDVGYKQNHDLNDENMSKKRKIDETDEDDRQLNEINDKKSGNFKKQFDGRIELGIKAPREAENSSNNQNLKNDNIAQDENDSSKLLENTEKRNDHVDDDDAVVPTTEELMDYILMDDPTKNDDNSDDDDDDDEKNDDEKTNTISPDDDSLPQKKVTQSKAYLLYQEILRLQSDCIQKSDEKVMVGKQTYQLLKSHLERLEVDLTTMEKILQTLIGEVFDTTGGIAPAMPNDLAACQVTPGSEWILAKVISYDQGMYTLSDEDVESDKIFNLPESQVIILPGNARFGNDHHKVAKGDVVFAIYPDTTSFYKSTVVSVPRKQASSSSSNAAAATAAALNQVAMVNFVDDSDEFGITHDKAVPLKYIMPPPPS